MASTPKHLPRPDFHFPGEVGRTYLDSDPAQFPQPVEAPKGAPNVLLILIDDCGFGQFGTFGGGIPSPTMDRLAAEGLRYNRFHTTALCSPTRAALITGPQPPLGRVRRHHRDRHRLRRLHLHLAAKLRHSRRSAATERLHDRLDRQEPQHAHLGDERCRSVRPLGQRPRVRLLLRLQRRRHEPLGSDPLREPQPRPGIDRSELPPHRPTSPTRPSPGFARSSSISPDQPFFLYVATGATHAPHQTPEGVDRQVQRQVRRGLGQVSRADARAAEETRRRSARHEAHGALEGPARVGLAQRRPEASLRAHDGSIRRLRAPNATTRLGRVVDAVQATPGRATTPSSSTSPATTARAPKAASKARSARTCSSTASRRSGRTTSRRSTSSAARSTSTTFRPPGRTR